MPGQARDSRPGGGLGRGITAGADWMAGVPCGRAEVARANEAAVTGEPARTTDEAPS